MANGLSLETKVLVKGRPCFGPYLGYSVLGCWMHAIRKLTNSPIKEDHGITIATVKAIPTIPIDRAEGRDSGPQLLSAARSSHTLQLFYIMLEDGCV